MWPVSASSSLLIRLCSLEVSQVSFLACAFVGAGVGSLAEHERNKHHSGTGSGSGGNYGSGVGSGTGGQYGAQGTDSFNNPQAPVSQSGAAVYNADGQAVGTGSTSLTPGQSVSTTSGRPSAYDSAANPGSRADTGRTGGGGGVSSHVPGTQSYRDTHGSGNTGTGSDYNSGRGTASGTNMDYNSGPGSATSGGSSRGGGGGGGLASVIPGTQAYRDKHVRQGDDFEGAGLSQGGGSNTGSGGGSGTHDNNYYEGRNTGSGGVGSGSGHHGHHHGHHGHEHSGAGAAAGQWKLLVLCSWCMQSADAACECSVSASCKHLVSVLTASTKQLMNLFSSAKSSGFQDQSRAALGIVVCHFVHARCYICSCTDRCWLCTLVAEAACV